jgi:hypothetical protein
MSTDYADYTDLESNAQAGGAAHRRAGNSGFDNFTILDIFLLALNTC